MNNWMNYHFAVANAPKTAQGIVQAMSGVSEKAAEMLLHGHPVSTKALGYLKTATKAP
jgi:hypothetical protein